jgi:hypothetical protein
MKLLTRDMLLAKQKLRIEKVDLGNDEYVYVREMTGQDRDRFDQMLMTIKNDGSGEKVVRSLDDFRAKLAVCTICDEEGNLLLKPEDYQALSKNISAARLDKIVTTAQELSKISEQDVNDMLKNSSDALSEDSTSG